MIFVNQFKPGRYIILQDDPPELLGFNLDRQAAEEIVFDRLPVTEALRLLDEPDLTPEGIARYRSTFAAVMAAETQRAGVSIDELDSKVTELQARAENAEENSNQLAKSLKRIQAQAQERERSEKVNKELKRRLELLAKLEGIDFEEAEASFGIGLKRILEGQL